MKKLIALLLVAVMCVSFVACGNESNNDTTQTDEINLKIIGTWKTDPTFNDYVLVINKDHTGSLSEGNETETLTWTYDDETHTLTLTKDNMPDLPPMPLTYVESNDTIVSTGPTFRRAETFPEKIERGTVTTSENPLLQVLFQTLADEGWSYTFNEDGTCADQVYWWIENDTENSMTIMVASEYKYKYQIGIWYDAPYVSIQANNATYNGDDFVAWQPPMKVYRIPYVGGTNPALSKAYGTWVPDGRPENYFTEFTINEDGTCIVDGISTIWSISKFSDDRHIFIEFWDTEHNSSLGGAVVSVNGDGNSLQIFIPNGAIGGGIFVRKTN